MPAIRNSDPFKIGAARYQRKSATNGERCLWRALRRKALGCRVKRQYPCGDYILDFYIHEARLCIEIDGPMHDTERDRLRDLCLGDLGILTIRIPADELPSKVDDWFEEIRVLSERRRIMIESGQLSI